MRSWRSARLLPATPGHCTSVWGEFSERIFREAELLVHAERCAALLFIIDISCEEPWKHFETLKFEMSQFSKELPTRPQIIVANKIDVPEAKENLVTLREMYDTPIIPISAKMGTNINVLLADIRKLYDQFSSIREL